MGPSFWVKGGRVVERKGVFRAPGLVTPFSLYLLVECRERSGPRLRTDRPPAWVGALAVFAVVRQSVVFASVSRSVGRSVARGLLSHSVSPWSWPQSVGRSLGVF